jgi:hypothetical protein
MPQLKNDKFAKEAGIEVYALQPDAYSPFEHRRKRQDSGQSVFVVYPSDGQIRPLATLVD